MENFIDIATPAELEEAYGQPLTTEEIEETREEFEKDADLNFQHLFWLYLGRGDKNTAQKYYDKIADPQRQLDAYMMAYECKD